MITFVHNGIEYRTNDDASVVEGHDGKSWNRTGSLGVRSAAQAALAGGKKTPAQLDAEIATELATAKPKKPRAPRKAKGKPARETKRQELERIVEERAASARYSHRHGLPDASQTQAQLNGARVDLARCIALDLGHNVLHQGFSYECNGCGASGRMDPDPDGKIFTDACTRPQAAAQIAYRSTP